MSHLAQYLVGRFASDLVDYFTLGLMGHFTQDLVGQYALDYAVAIMGILVYNNASH
ncbi:MAG: hypothetical protein IPQ02_16270 [Saprospiraceae bacterium]|nr:hypothetical protein [Candidatus Defluviibacterium haderslevense]